MAAATTSRDRHSAHSGSRRSWARRSLRHRSSWYQPRHGSSHGVSRLRGIDFRSSRPVGRIPHSASPRFECRYLLFAIRARAFRDAVRGSPRNYRLLVLLIVVRVDVPKRIFTMKKIVIAIATLLITIPAFAGPPPSRHHGHHVMQAQVHMRTGQGPSGASRVAYAFLVYMLSPPTWCGLQIIIPSPMRV